MATIVEEPMEVEASPVAKISKSFSKDSVGSKQSQSSNKQMVTEHKAETILQDMVLKLVP